MCLSFAKANKKKLFGNKEEIICWKVVTKNEKRRRYYPPFYFNLPYALGKLNISNRKRKEINKVDDNLTFGDYIKGFHVFIREEDAEDWASYSEYVVPVKCKRENYVAHNDRHALFMAIEFPKRIKKEWKKG